MFLCLTINDVNVDTISSTINYDAVIAEKKTGVNDMALVSQNSNFAFKKFLNDDTSCDRHSILAANRCLADNSFYTPPTDRFLSNKAVYTPATNEYLAATYARFIEDERDHSATSNSIDDGHTADTNISDDDFDLVADDYNTKEEDAEDAFEYPADVYCERKKIIETEHGYSLFQDIRSPRVLTSFCQRKSRSVEKCSKCRKPFKRTWYGSRKVITFSNFYILHICNNCFCLFELRMYI
jgi:hypothetical protein